VMSSQNTPMLRAALLLAFAPALVYACTASEVCTTASDWDPNGTGGDMCCEDASCAAFNYNEIDPTCTGCVGTPYSTQATCTAAGKIWSTFTCAQMAPGFAGSCSSLQPQSVAIGNNCCSGANTPAAAACTAADICASASSYDASAIAGNMCCEDASCAAFNYNEIDPTCDGCVGTPYSTQATCTGAGKFWFPTTCAQIAPNYAGFCNLMEAGALAIGNSCCPPPSPPPASVASTSDDPCFPSSAVVTKADGSKVSVNTLREGDAIAAVTANGELTTDTVSLLSIVKPEVAATAFLVLTATADKSRLVNLTVTAAHHVPVGAACCSSLKQAGEVEIGEIIYTIKNGRAAPSTVTMIGKVVKAGLHSPVLTNGHFPVVDDTVTAFDSATKMHLAAYALPILEPACKATGTCTSLKMLVGKITGRKY